MSNGDNSYKPTPAIPGVCPVCAARFRGNRFCSRCGVDLAPLMTLMVRAHQSRGRARAAFRAGRFAEAAREAQQAQALCADPSSESLLGLAQWLTRVGDAPG